MYKINIIKHYKYKQHWLDWLKYKLPIPKHITPLKINNLIGGYGTYNKLKKGEQWKKKETKDIFYQWVIVLQMTHT